MVTFENGMHNREYSQEMGKENRNSSLLLTSYREEEDNHDDLVDDGWQNKPLGNESLARVMLLGAEPLRKHHALQSLHHGTKLGDLQGVDGGRK